MEQNAGYGAEVLPQAYFATLTRKYTSAARKRMPTPRISIGRKTKSKAIVLTGSREDLRL